MPRPRPDRRKLAEAAALLQDREEADPHLRRRRALFARRERRRPNSPSSAASRSSKPSPARAALTHYHPAHAGPIGIIGSTSANALAAEADVILAVGTRLQDFTTGSWTAFRPDAKFISINAARFDAVKHRALAVVGDALETVAELDAALGFWRVDPAHMARAKALFKEWDALLDAHQAPTNAPVPTYAQVVHVVNAAAGENDTLISAAGGLPGEVDEGLAGQGAEHVRPASSASPAWATRSRPAGGTRWRIPGRADSAARRSSWSATELT